jgi:hypothetical protein
MISGEVARYARLIADIEKALEKSIDAAKVVLDNKIKNLRTTATKRTRKLLDGHQARMGILTKRKKIEDARGKTAPRELVKVRKYILGRIRFVNLLSNRMTERERQAYGAYAAHYLSDHDRVLISRVIELPDRGDDADLDDAAARKGRGPGALPAADVEDRKIKYVIGAIDHKILTEPDEEKVNKFLQKMIVRDLQMTINAEREFDVIKDIMPAESRVQTVREFYIGKSRIRPRGGEQRLSPSASKFSVGQVFPESVN